MPDDHGLAFADGLGLDGHHVAERFRDYWRGTAGAKGRKADWPATWRNWCRRAAESLPQARAGPVRRPAQNGAMELMLQARSAHAPARFVDAEDITLPLLEGFGHAGRSR